MSKRSKKLTFGVTGRSDGRPFESPLRPRATALRSAVVGAGGAGGVGGVRGPLLGEGCNPAPPAVASESARRGGRCIASARSGGVEGGRGGTKGEEGVSFCFSSQLRVRSSAAAAMVAGKPVPVAAPVAVAVTAVAVRPVAVAVATAAVAAAAPLFSRVEGVPGAARSFVSPGFELRASRSRMAGNAKTALPLLELRCENAQPAAPPPPPLPPPPPPPPPPPLPALPRGHSKGSVFHFDEPGGVDASEAEYSVGDISRIGISLGWRPAAVSSRWSIEVAGLPLPEYSYTLICGLAER